MDDVLLDSAYRLRLHIDQADPLEADGNTLRRLVEAHLRYIPFENLSMHGCRDLSNNACDEPVIPLNLPLLYNKVLERNRGGCCFELNGLLGHYLLELGYPVVKLVPCWVYAGPERGHARSKKAKFRTRQTHAFLLVRTHDGQSYIADVGLGEPPLHPLKYGKDMLDEEQITPEGMRSRIVREERDWVDGDGRVRKCLLLEWWRDCRACFQCGERKQINSTTTAEIKALQTEADKLRIQADKARKRSKTKLRSEFKVYSSCPSVRNDAEGRLLLRNDHTIEHDEHIPAKVSGADIRREICDMWASLSGDDRRKWKDKAAEELEALKKEADKCEVIAARAEEDLTEALSLAKESYRCDDSTECDELCDGKGEYWEPRLQWDIADASLVASGNELSFVKDRPLEYFANAADIIAGPGSSFVTEDCCLYSYRNRKDYCNGQ